MSDNIPQLLKGFRDFGPRQMANRLTIFAAIRAVFERFGFEPMETPALEYASVLAGKYGAEEKLMYRFTDHGGRLVALRYDHTVPLARFYNLHKHDLPKPFKRYVIGPVWRAENTQKGRFREFYQCDVDCVGSAAAAADTDAIAAIATALTEVGVSGIEIKLNNRKIIDGLLASLSVPQQLWVAVMRELDKLDKVSKAEVAEALVRAGLEQSQIKKLFSYLDATPASVQALQKLFSKVIMESKLLSEGVAELSAVLGVLGSMGVKGIVIDLALARGLDYYTGTVCEMVLSKLPTFGSIAGGGRYDKLIGEFGDKKEVIPAVGMSIGIDRLLSALEEIGAPPAFLPRCDVIVVQLDERLRDVYLRLVTQLRQTGVATDFYYQKDSLERQFKYAEKKQIRFAVIVGEDEVKAGTVVVKDLEKRQQRRVEAEQIIETVTKFLEDDAAAP